MITISKEDYLKAIFEYNELTGGPATTSSIAEILKVSNAATSEMAKKLYADGLIDYQKYRGMGLTNKGKKIAVSVVRRHRIWELFLMRVLDLSWDEIHTEAERIEHHTSDNLVNKIEKFLNYPKFDPHGHPIPNVKCVFPKRKSCILLTEAKEGMKYEIAMVSDKNKEMLDYFRKLDLIPGKEIIVKNKLLFDNSTIIEIDGYNHTLSEKICILISVSTK